MAFLRLPGRNLNYPSVGRVPLLPQPIVKPSIAASIAAALPSILKNFDPLEKAKEDAQIAYYNYLKGNPTGVKPLTPLQQASMRFLDAKRKALIDKSNVTTPFNAYEAAARGMHSPTTPFKPQIVTPNPPAKGSLGAFGDPRTYSLGQDLNATNDLSTANLNAPPNTSDNTSYSEGPLSDSNLEPTVDNSVDLSGLKNQFIVQNPDLSDREAELLAQEQVDQAS